MEFETKQLKGDVLLSKLTKTVSPSASVYKNCKVFCQSLLANTMIREAEVWLLEEAGTASESKSYFQFYTTIKFKSDSNSIAEKYIAARLREVTYFIVDQNDHDFSKLQDGAKTRGGTYLIFKLGSVGFIKCYTKSNLSTKVSSSNNTFTSASAQYLYKAIFPFGLLLNGLIACDNLKKGKENTAFESPATQQQNHMPESTLIDNQQVITHISHELRTPLNSVIGMTQLLSDTNLNDQQKEYLKCLDFSANSLKGIINNTLDISKIEAGELQLEKRPFQLKQLLKSLHHSFRFTLKDKAVSMKLDIDANIKNQIIGDGTRLNQILSNLLSNACNFTSAGSVELKVRLLASIEKEYVLQFEVKDTGIGIPEDKMDVVFQEFKQASEDTTRKYGGTGLGLPIVKALVAQLNGNIELESEVNNGSTFRVVLPFEHTGQPEAALGRKKEKVSNDNSILQKGHYLFVEDDIMNQKLIAAILNNWNCTFDIAKNGAEAMAFSRQKKYDLIFMDINLPIMSGLDITSKIKAEWNNPNNASTFVALTGALTLQEREEAQGVGMVDFLGKPFTPKRLRGLICW
ncbi:MAG: ATP-binding protein [Saprospiraceae bacterium]